MDFEKIKPAVEEIQLSEIQQQRIIENCEKQKRRKFNYKLWIPVAAAAVFTVVIFSPGFIFSASKSADSMAEAENGKGFGYLADSYGGEINDEEIYVSVEDYLPNEVYSVQNQSTAVEINVLFDSGNYREIYSVIPSQFVWLVDFEDYKIWKNTVDSTNGMAMLQFVEHFGITREDFDSANKSYEAYINSLGKTALKNKPSNKAEESCEIFNAEIIYSFDRETIDSYYLAE